MDIYETAKLKPYPVSGYEISTIAESADFHFTDDDLVAKLHKTAKELRERVRADRADCADNCSGPRTQKFLIEENAEPYRAIAERYLKINCSVFSQSDSGQIETRLEAFVEIMTAA